MIFILLLVLHILVAFMLVMSILLQTGQGGGLSSAFGGGNQTLFGGRGAATFLSKATTYLGAGFLVLSFTLALVHSHRSRAVEPTRNIIQEQMAPRGGSPGSAPASAPAGTETGSPLPTSPPGAPQTPAGGEGQGGGE